MEKDEFEKIIIKTIESLPAKFKKKLKNVDITIEEEDTRYYIKGKNSADNKYKAHNRNRRVYPSQYIKN